MRYLILTFLCSIGISAIFAQKRFVDDAGIEREYLKSVDSLFLATNRHDYLSEECNLDNLIYLPEKEFLYEYYYEREGQQYLFDPSLGGQRIWPLNKLPQKNTIVRLGFSIEHENMVGMTVCKHNYYSGDGEVGGLFEKSGIIENERNTWLHPPRSEQFAMLELNPYPYVKFPLKIGRTWDWELEIGDDFSSSFWVAWKGAILNKYWYRITDRSTLQTSLGKIDCWVIESGGTSQLGQTSLTAFFNELLGFVKLEYTNIDGTKLVMNLTEIRVTK